MKKKIYKKPLNTTLATFLRNWDRKKNEKGFYRSLISKNLKLKKSSFLSNELQDKKPKKNNEQAITTFVN